MLSLQRFHFISSTLSSRLLCRHQAHHAVSTLLAAMIESEYKHSTRPDIHRPLSKPRLAYPAARLAILSPCLLPLKRGQADPQH
jgi:hypothetical protein